MYGYWLMSNFKSFWADKYHAIITQAKYSWIRSSSFFFFSQGSVNPHHAKFPMRRRKEQEDGWPSPYSLMVLPMSSPRNKDRKQQQGEDGERGSLDGKSTWTSWNTLHDFVFMCFICVKAVCIWVLKQMTGLELMWCFCSCCVLFQQFSRQILLRVPQMILWIVKDKTSTPNVHMLEYTNLHIQ